MPFEIVSFEIVPFKVVPFKIGRLKFVGISLFLGMLSLPSA